MQYGRGKSALRALITGATGLIGRALAACVAEPVVLSRAPERVRPLEGARVYAWEPLARPPPEAAFDGVECVFHLAGEPVAQGRWSASRKAAIRDSRVVGTRHLVAALAGIAPVRRPPVLVSASGVGFYGDRGDEVLVETSTPGTDFLAEVCTAWEREALVATHLGVRVVCVRIGIVLARQGGALARMLPAFRLGAGGRLGSGQQWMSWIHLDDVVGLLLHASRTAGISGPMNATAPLPVRNAEFVRDLGRVLHRPALLPVPALALRLVLGEMSQLLLGSQRAMPTVADASGYEYRHPRLREALASAIRS